jgi:ribosomal protein S12 methylthiotransferase accessory factor
MAEYVSETKADYCPRPTPVHMKGDERLHVGRQSDVIRNSAGLESLGVAFRLNGQHLLLLRPDVCPQCLEIRIAALLPPAGLKTPITIPSSIFLEESAWLTAFACETAEILAQHLRRTTHSSSPSGYGIHLPSLATYQFELEPIANCPQCGGSKRDTSDDALIHLENRSRKDNYRQAEVGETDIDVTKYLNPTCGMFGKAIMLNRDHIFQARAGGSFWDAGSRFRVSWTGQKDTFQSSLTVGLFEAFERHAGLAPRSKQLSVYDTYANLANEALDPRDLGLYDSSYYESHPELVPFSEDLPLKWVWGYSLTERRSILVPYQLAYYGAGDRNTPRIVHDNSNGCASGTCVEEAIFHALLELIERDAFVIHWHARISPPQIDVDTIADSDLYFLIQRLRRANLDIHLLDTRLDIPVPSVTAVLLRRDRELGTLSLAAGCSFNPESAIASALGEVASHYVGFQERTSDAEGRLSSALQDLSLIKVMDDHSLLYGLPEAAPLAEFLLSNKNLHSMEDLYTSWRERLPKTRDLRDDIGFCLNTLEQAGLKQVVVVDQSSPEGMRVGLRTVRVIVPGLMPLDFGFRRCRAASLARMYSVPAKLGVEKAPITARDLYYAPHPFP